MLSFYVKFVQTDGQTDRWTDRRTTVKQYAPDLSTWGHKSFVQNDNNDRHIKSLVFENFLSKDGT